MSETKTRTTQVKSAQKMLFKSKNWFKQKAKIARTHYRIACIRNDAHHKGTTDIVNRASGIAIETLKVTNMLKNRKLAKALSDSALGGFLSKLKTKSETYWKYLLQKHLNSLQVAKPVAIADIRKKN